MHNSRTLILWGAGATATLGVRTTAQQTEFLINLAADESNDPHACALSTRVTNAFRETEWIWRSALTELLVILGDANDVNDTFKITPEQLSAMRDNWDGDDDALRNRILSLRMLYDWIALKSIIKILHSENSASHQIPKFLTDLINILDIQSTSGHGFRISEREFLTPVRIAGARNALKMLFLTMFFIDWQSLRSDEKRRRTLDQYYDFALTLGERVQLQGVSLAQEHDLQSSEFYLSNISIASLNYDPIAVWLQFVAYRELNKSPSVPHIGSSVHRLQMYHDFAHPVPSVRIGGKRPGTPRMAMTESAVQRINDPSHGATDRIRISKFLFLHGCTNWRECPNCGKLTAFTSDRWEIDTPTLFSIPPLRAFSNNAEPDFRIEREEDKFREGEVDVRACVHCNALTYMHHTQIIMQSNFKSAPPPFIQEIQRDFRVVVEESEHIIFMGYSLPPDDVDYRAFFAVRQNHTKKVKCSIVIGQDSRYQRWMMPTDLSNLDELNLCSHNKDTLEAAQNLFGKDHVRFYGGGIPRVFLDGENVSESAIDRLLYWNSTE